MKIRPYRIGFRTVKTAFGMALGVIICKLLGIDNYASAAILVVLCVKNTRVKSLQAASARFFSCTIGLLFSYIFFTNLGFHAVVLGLLVLVFIPVTVMFRIEEGVVTSCVIILHCFNFGYINWHVIINELTLIIVGLTIALMLNLYMPSLSKDLHRYKNIIETDLQLIVAKLSDALMYPDIILSKDKLKQLHITIEEAKSVAYTEVENHFTRNENSYYHYFDMREDQLELIYRMVDLINQMDHCDKLHVNCSNLLLDLSNNISSNNFTAMRLHDLYAIMIEVEQYPLPQSNAQMKSRAALMQLLNEIEHYLEIKSNFGSLKLY